MRRTAFIIASVLVSALFLWLTLRDINLAELATSISQANPFWLLASFLSTGLALYLRGVRWRGLLGFRISLRNAFYIFNITMLMNQLPFRIGEIARSLLATRFNVPFVTAATSIVVERLLDLLMVVLLIAIGLSRAPNAAPAVSNGATLFGILAVVGFIVLIAFARFPDVPRSILIWLERRISLLSRLQLRKRLDEVLDGLRPLTDLGHAVHAIGWTLVGWGASLLTFYCVERAFDVQTTGVDLWLLSALAIAMASLGIAIPVTVAGIGAFEGAVRLAGDTVGLDPSTSTALGFTLHGVTVLAYAVFGVISLVALGVSFSDLLSRSAEVEEAVVEGE